MEQILAADGTSIAPPPPQKSPSSKLMPAVTIISTCECQTNPVPSVLVDQNEESAVTAGGDEDNMVGDLVVDKGKGCEVLPVEKEKGKSSEKEKEKDTESNEEADKESDGEQAENGAESDVVVEKGPLANESDVHMQSPPQSPQPAEGSSRTTGGIIRGRAIGNVYNHGDQYDFPKIETTTSVKGTVFIYSSPENPFKLNTQNLCPMTKTLVPLNTNLGPVLKKIAEDYSPIRSKSITLR